MIDFNFEQYFKQDFEIPINMASVDKRFQENNKERNMLLAEHFGLFSESYLHAGDIVFKDYFEYIENNQGSPSMVIYEVNMFGVIQRLYYHAIEMKLKSLLYNANYEPRKEHVFSEFIKKIEDLYYVPFDVLNGDSNDVKQSLDYIKKLDTHSNGSQTGRYPINSKGDVIGSVEDECVHINGIVNMVYQIHHIFKDVFPKLKLKSL